MRQFQTEAILEGHQLAKGYQLNLDLIIHEPQDYEL